MSSASTNPIGVGIIGCGQISRFHHEGYAQAGARIVHVCDLRLDAAQAVAGRYGARATDQVEQLLADPAVQLVSILTTAASHKPLALAALAAGKGVVCEKTLADSPAHAAEIARAADASGLYFSTAYMKRFFPAAQQARRLLDDMGPVISIHARSWQPSGWWTDPIEGYLLERPSPVIRGYGGGVLVCGGSHILDLIHWFGGQPTKVCGQMLTREGMDFDVQANAMLWLPEGGLAHLECAWHQHKHVGYERNGWDERLEINTLAGRLDFYTVTWNNPVNGALLVHTEASGKSTEYRYPAVNPFDLEMAEHLRRFAAGEPGWPSAWDGWVVDATIEAITRSAQTGAVVELPAE